MANVSADKLKRLKTFAGLDDEQLSQLAENAQLRTVKAGSPIVNKVRDADQVQFLLSGSVEIRASFFDRQNFSHIDQEATAPLEEAASAGIAVNAATDCIVVKFFRTQLEAAQDKHLLDARDFDIDLASSAEAYEVSESEHQADDWLSRFLMSPMVGHLSASTIHRLLGAVREVPVEQGQVVVELGQPGDKFYIVKSGVAEVFTAPASATASQTIDLMPGDYFGEEALVGDTTRNARVSMKTAGVLCVMDRQAFNELIRQSLIVTSPKDQLLAEDDSNQVLLDVRLYPEYRQGHVASSHNLPLAQLRQKLRDLDGSKRYVITPEGGARSELATFLMRQAGFDAVLLQSA